MSKKPLKAVLYARVSTGYQSTENQLRELREAAERFGWVVTAEYVDEGISGSKGRLDRPQLDAVLKGLARKEFDVLASWSVDRLGRSLGDLASLLTDMHSVGVDLYLHKQGINTTIPSGRAMFQMMGVFAEFEREMIRDRVNSGLAVVKATGKNKHGEVVTLGRPKVSVDVEQQIQQLRATGMGKLKIAKTVGCGVSVVQRLVV